MSASGVIRGFVFSLIWACTQAQNIPINNWQTHFSYLSAHQVAVADGRIFCATRNGFFRYDPADQTYRTFSKITGLNDTGIASMAYSAAANLILLAYRSGNMDILHLDNASNITEILNWPVLASASTLPGNKQIHQIVFLNNLAYLSTNFGIAVMDVENREVLETYRYIGGGGNEVNVENLAFSADSIYAVTNEGLLRASLKASVNKQYFANWTKVAGEVVAIASANNQLYAALAGKGIYKKSDGAWKLIFSSSQKEYTLTNDNGTLLVTAGNTSVSIDPQDQITRYNNPLFSNLTQPARANGELWLADTRNGLLSNPAGSFRPYVPETGDTTLFPRKDSVVTDGSGLTWSRVPNHLGGGIMVRDVRQNQQRLLSISPGNGGLPSSNINSLAVDEDGYVWFASDRGVGYFVPDPTIFTTRIDAILPVFGNRKLFSTEKCTAIITEPGNRKWIGTRSGLYQFNADGSEMVQKFTAADSPLPSDQINALDFEESKGLLYIDTPDGMVSFRTGASEAAADLSQVTIFPNPVRPGYGGSVGITGLVGNSTVKITELSGRLVFETQSRGGTASWNLNDYTGKRARGGIYMVLVVSEDGSEKSAGKLAVID